MGAQKTVTINGRLYDAATGLPIEGSKPEAAREPKKAVKSAAAARAHKPSENVHSTVQKSKTLVRRVTKKPVAPQKVVRRPKPGQHMDIARSSNVSKFAAHPAAAPKPVESRPVAKPLVPDAPATPHPTAERALAKTEAKKSAVAKVGKPATAKQVKDQAIDKAMSASKPKGPSKKQQLAAKQKRNKRIVIVAGIILLVLGALFAVYKFIPSVSVGIAAAQAGVSATYPDFTPDGYRLSQPVTYSDGEVVLEFVSNSNDTSYSINQKRSSWDSSAVLDSIVTPLVGENYTTTRERGLTLYTYRDGAAWVNGGVLYIISGNAALSGDQVRRIATSL